MAILSRTSMNRNFLPIGTRGEGREEDERVPSALAPRQIGGMADEAQRSFGMARPAQIDPSYTSPFQDPSPKFGPLLPQHTPANPIDIFKQSPSDALNMIKRGATAFDPAVQQRLQNQHVSPEQNDMARRARPAFATGQHLETQPTELSKTWDAMFGGPDVPARMPDFYEAMVEKGRTPIAGETRTVTAPGGGTATMPIRSTVSGFYAPGETAESFGGTTRRADILGGKSDFDKYIEMVGGRDAKGNPIALTPERRKEAEMLYRNAAQEATIRESGAKAALGKRINEYKKTASVSEQESLKTEINKAKSYTEALGIMHRNTTKAAFDAKRPGSADMSKSKDKIFNRTKVDEKTGEYKGIDGRVKKAIEAAETTLDSEGKNLLEHMSASDRKLYEDNIKFIASSGGGSKVANDRAARVERVVKDAQGEMQKVENERAFKMAKEKHIATIENIKSMVGKRYSDEEFSRWKIEGDKLKSEVAGFQKVVSSTKNDKLRKKAEADLDAAKARWEQWYSSTPSVQGEQLLSKDEFIADFMSSENREPTEEEIAQLQGRAWQ